MHDDDDDDDDAFVAGDLIRLRTGAAPIVVTAVSSDRVMLAGVHLFSEHDVPTRACRDFVPFGAFNEEGIAQLSDAIIHDWLSPDRKRAVLRHMKKMENEEMTNKLFQTPDSRFGTQIATNSEGYIVLEMRGEGGKVEAFPEADLTEVLPYTVKIGGGHYEAPKGKLAEGDVVFLPRGASSPGVFQGVQAVDTKSRGASPLPRGTRRVVTEAL